MWLRKRDQKIQDATFLFLCVMALYSLGTKMRVLLEGLAPLILFGLPLAALEAELHLGFFGWNWARVWTQPILLSLKQKDLLLAWAYRPEFSLGGGAAKLGLLSLVSWDLMKAHSNSLKAHSFIFEMPTHLYFPQISFPPKTFILLRHLRPLSHLSFYPSRFPLRRLFLSSHLPASILSNPLNAIVLSNCSPET